MEKTESPIMIMICGSNGSGKSTYTKATALMSDHHVIVIDPDQLYAQKGLSVVAAGKMASGQAKKLIADKQSFVRESTLTANFDFELIKIAKRQGYQINLVFIGLNSAEDAIARVKYRHAKGGHNVPENDIIRRYFRSLNNLPKAITSVDTALLLHNTRNSYENVAYFEHGNLIQVYFRPSWYQRLGCCN